MHLKSQISKFRSEVLVGCYDSAISMGKSILAQIDILIILKILKDDKLQSLIQEEYQKCLAINSTLKQKISSTSHQQIKKWKNGSKEGDIIEGKWKKVRKAIQSEQEVVQSEQCWPVGPQMSKEYVQFEQLVERQIMMRVKMPSFFKSQTSLFKIIACPQQHYSSVLAYFMENGFTTISYHQFEQCFHQKQDNWASALSEGKQILIDSRLVSPSSILQMKAGFGRQSLNCVFAVISHTNSFQMI